MATLNEKMIETKKLEDQANLIREEIDRLQKLKSDYFWQRKDTSEIDEKMEELREDLNPIWEAFEVSLGEIGEEEYYNFLKGMGEDKNDRYKTY